MQKVVVAGGTGFIGKNLVTRLQQKSYQVYVVSRTAKPAVSGITTLTWDNIRKEGLPDNTKGVIQLAGHSILRLPWWTDAHKEKVISSRVDTGRWLVEALGKSKQKPEVYIASSAIGYYPFNQMSDPAFTEDTCPSPADNFAGKVCASVESEVNNAQEIVQRAISLRVGVVLGKGGGMLQNTWLPFWLGLGGVTGSGKQPMPWIHLADQVNLFIHALENNQVNGPLNGVAPGIVDNYAFTKAMGRAMRRPTVLFTPEFVLKTVMGEQAMLLLEGSNITPEKALKTGFKFQFPEINGAMEQIFA